jgi:hypothetical protein
MTKKKEGWYLHICPVCGSSKSIFSEGLKENPIEEIRENLIKDICKLPDKQVRKAFKMIQKLMRG